MDSANQRIRVLVADDSQTALLSVCKYLEFEGEFEVVGTAGDGMALVDKTSVRIWCSAI